MTFVTALKADRRLYVTADRTRVVEESDPAASWLLYAVGRKVGEGDIQRYGLEADEHGRVAYRGSPDLPEPAEEEITVEADADHSDRNDASIPKWTGRRSPEAYFKQYPKGPKAELAAAIIAAKEDGAGGAS